jgi:hypothetical protein
MLLLVLISAIVFLVARNNELEELAEVFSGQSLPDHIWNLTSPS